MAGPLFNPFDATTTRRRLEKLRVQIDSTGLFNRQDTGRAIQRVVTWMVLNKNLQVAETMQSFSELVQHQVDRIDSVNVEMVVKRAKLVLEALTSFALFQRGHPKEMAIDRADSVLRSCLMDSMHWLNTNMVFPNRADSDVTLRDICNNFDDAGLAMEWMRPEWDKAGKIHDWRNYIGQAVREIWDTFTPRQKSVLVQAAQAQADREEWD